MDVVAYESPSGFWEAAGPLYRKDPVRHTLALTVLRQLVDSPDEGAPQPLLLTVVDEGAVVGATFRTPPWPLVTSGLSVTTAPVVVSYLRGRGVELNGVNGPREQSVDFAARWSSVTGLAARELMAQRLYRLGSLRMPEEVAGELQLAGEADVPLLSNWRKEFVRDAHMAEELDDDRWPTEALRRSLDGGNPHGIWSVEGVPASYAAASKPLHGMVRIGPVYTPPESRRRGYGAAVTAAMSQWALDAGATDVLLFTDLANPTSNSIYRKIGYVPVYDAAEFRFATTVG